MLQEQLSAFLIEQSDDLIWVIDSKFNLVFANASYLDFMYDMTGQKKILNESIFEEDLDEVYVERWRGYYKRVLDGEIFEVEECFKQKNAQTALFNQIIFKPFNTQSNDSKLAVCQSRNITKFKKLRSQAIDLMDASLDVFCTINEEGKFVFVSGACSSHWGYTAEELYHIPYRSLILEEDIPKTDEAAEKIVSGTEVRTFINRYKRKDGGIAYNLWSARWDSHANLMYCIARDAKEHLEKEELILRSEQRFKALVQEGSDLIAILDVQGIYTYVSPTSFIVLGMAPEEFIGKSPFDYIHPEDKDNVLSSLQEIFNTSKVNVEPFRFKDSQGDWRWIETVLTNMVNNPSVEGVVANSRDITDKIAEQHRLKLLESVITNTKDAVLITEAEPVNKPGPRIVYVNEAFTQMTGYTSEEVIGKTPRILQGPKSDRKELERLRAALLNWEPCEITTLNYKKSGEEFWINFSVSPVADERGWFTHWIAIERDVTEQKNKDLEKEMIAQISSAFNLDNNFKQAAEELCSLIADYGHFDAVELWTSDITHSEMRIMGHCSDSPENTSAFQASGAAHTSKGKGLARKVWANEKITLWRDHEDDDEALTVKQMGFKSMLGIPLPFRGQVLGVMLIGSKGSEVGLRSFSPMAERLQTVIGSEIRRKMLEDELTHLFDAIPDLVSVFDAKGRFLRINPIGCDLLGYSEEAILHERLEKFIHSEDILLAKQVSELLINDQSEQGFEARFLRKTGEVIWLSWHFNTNVHEGLIYATAKNITEEKSLRELNRQARQLAKIGSWEVNLLNNSLYWSDEVFQLHELDPQTGAPSVEKAIYYYRSDHRKMVEEMINRCIETGEPFDFEAVLVTAKKNEVWVRSIGQAEIINNQCTRVFGSFQDITEGKAVELRLKSLAENLPGVVFEYYIYPDGSDTLKYVTKGAKDVWGYDALEASENNQLIWDQIKAGGQLDHVKESITQAIESKSNWSARWKYIMPQGEERTHLGLGSPNFLSDGTIMFHSVILDVTREEKNEELLNEVSKAAQIGTWEIDLMNGGHFYSSTILDILEASGDHELSNFDILLEFCKEEDREGVLSRVRDSIQSGMPFDFETTVITRSFKEKWVRVIGTPKMQQDKCVKIIGSLQDVSPLKETEIRLQSISNNLPGVVYQYIVNPDGSDELRSVSGAVEELWGFTSKEVLKDINLIWEQIRAGGQFDLVKESVVKSIETKSMWSTTIKYMMPSGELRTHLGNGTPNFLADGSVVFNSIILDVTQEEKNAQQLRQTADIARIGSWELNLTHQDNDSMYWSPTIFDILELDDSYDPSYSGGLELHLGESRPRIEKCMNKLMTSGEEFDEEVLVKTGKGNEKWARVIGKCEQVNGKVKRIFGSIQDITVAKKLALQIREILESISDAFYALDADWNFTYYNKQAEVLLKKEEQVVIGNNIWEVFPDVKNTLLEEKYRTIAETQKPDSFEYYFPGDNNWYEVSAYPSRDGISVYFKNITERIKAAGELEAAYEEKKNILESIGDGFFTVDKNWIITYWNNQAESLLSLSKDEVLSKNLWEVFEDAIDTDFYRNYHEALETGKSISFEEYYERSKQWFAVSVYPSLNGLSIFFKDITTRKTAGIRLAQANERFEKVTEATSDAIWDWDIEQDNFFRSKNSRKIFGESASLNLTSEHFWEDQFHPDDLERVKRSLYEVLEDPTTNRWESEYRVFNQVGEVVYVMDRGVIMRDPNGKAIRIIGALSDITKTKTQENELRLLNESLKAYANELERSNEELEQFAFITSHDLQEPLRMVTSFMDQLSRKYGDQLDEKAHEYIHYATDGAKRMKRIILDLLEYSRAGRNKDSKERLDMNQILSDFKLLRRKVISEKSVTFNETRLPTIYSYSAAVTQILHSLLDNAIKYSRDGVSPVITISYKSRKSEWLFSIEDNGIGIDPAFHEKIFVIFQRLHNRMEYEGTGIGLSIAKKHVEFLGGELWLKSTVNVGTTFYFTIPKQT